MTAWWGSNILLKVPQRHSVFTPGGVLHSNNYLRLFAPFLLFQIFKQEFSNYGLISEEPGGRCYQIRKSRKPSWKRGGNSSRSKSNRSNFLGWRWYVYLWKLNFLERAQLTKGLAAIYWRSGIGAAIAFAGGKLRRSYSLRYLCGTVRVPCGSLIFNHSKTSPAHGKRQSTCLYISSRWLTLGRHVAHLEERLAQIAFCLFADRRNNPLCGVLMKILLV